MNSDVVTKVKDLALILLPFVVLDILPKHVKAVARHAKSHTLLLLRHAKPYTLLLLLSVRVSRVQALSGIVPHLATIVTSRFVTRQRV